MSTRRDTAILIVLAITSVLAMLAAIQVLTRSSSMVLRPLDPVDAGSRPSGRVEVPPATTPPIAEGPGRPNPAKEPPRPGRRGKAAGPPTPGGGSPTPRPAPARRETGSSSALANSFTSEGVRPNRSVGRRPGRLTRPPLASPPTSRPPVAEPARPRPVPEPPTGYGDGGAERCPPNPRPGWADRGPKDGELEGFGLGGVHGPGMSGHGNGDPAVSYDGTSGPEADRPARVRPATRACSLRAGRVGTSIGAGPAMAAVAARTCRPATRTGTGALTRPLPARARSVIAGTRSRTGPTRSTTTTAPRPPSPPSRPTVTTGWTRTTSKAAILATATSATTPPGRGMRAGATGSRRSCTVTTRRVSAAAGLGTGSSATMTTTVKGATTAGTASATAPVGPAITSATTTAGHQRHRARTHRHAGNPGGRDGGGGDMGHEGHGRDGDSGGGDTGHEDHHRDGGDGDWGRGHGGWSQRGSGDD